MPNLQSGTREAARAFRVTIYGLPVPQGRPRTRIVVGRGKPFATVYDPQNSRSWKQTVAVQVQASLPADWSLLEGPLRLELIFRLPRPKSARKAEVYPAKRPDWDNLSRGVTDVLEGVLYHNDAQIVAATVSKHYGDRPGVEIDIGECL